MKKALKVILLIFGGILTGVVIFALFNVKSILLALGIGKLEVKDYDTAKSTLEQSQMYTNIKVLDDPSPDGTKTITFTTQDKVADFTIQGKTGEEISKVDAEIHGDKLKGIDPTDVNAISNKARVYLSPIIADEQILGLSGFIAKEALSQYNLGKQYISIQQNFDGVYVSVEGDINTLQFSVEINTNQENATTPEAKQ